MAAATPSIPSSPATPAYVSSGLTPTTPDSASLLRGSNPLSSKVTTALSSSYADSEFREALSILDGRGLQNNPETRRRLRLDLQKEVIDSNGEIVADFGRVADQLRRIGQTIETLNRSHADMKRQISEAHDCTAPVLQEASSLIARKRQVETKQRLLRSLQGHYFLSEDEVAVLTLSAEPVDDRFFTLLARARRISKDCEVLLGFENQTLGLQVMEQTSKNLNVAFQKLYRWIQREFKTLNLENPQIGSSIRRALRVLAERRPLFQNCLDFFAEAREHVLSDAFFTALTGASPAGAEDPTVKPIELAAHDSLRYVGDMLAWTHSAAVSEREALEVLFVSDGNEIARGIQSGRDTELGRLVDDEGDEAPEFNPIQALNGLVDRNVSGAARTLRQRVEQVIQTNEDTILAYKLANLLGFYRFTFAKLLGENSQLVEALRNLDSEALRQFRSLMRDHIAALQGEFQHVPADLAPPEFLLSSLEQLTAIMRTYETSLTSSTDPEADFQPILAEALEPFVSGCRNIAEGIQSPANLVFLVNCLVATKHALMPFDFTRGRVDRLEAEIAERCAQLSSYQYGFFRVESGLDAIFTALELLTDAPDDVRKVRGLAALAPAELVQASQILDDFLPSGFMDALENMKPLQEPRLAREITEDAAERFCVDFERVEDLLIHADDMAEEENDADGESSGGHDGDEGHDDGRTRGLQNLRSLFPRTSGEIRVLLS